MKTNTFTSTLMEMEKYIDKDKHGLAESIPIDSPMINFYRNKSVFLTGGTGFLGQLFVEKLLRCGVKEIFVLARAKKGKESKQRLAEVYSGAVYEKLSKIDPNYMERIRPVEGNMTELGVGISTEDRADMIERVEIVLHSAAEVRFDETLQRLLLVNLRGTREVLRLAEQMKRLQVLVHISTAYSHCPMSHVAEQFYRPPFDPHRMIELAEQLIDNEAGQIEFEIMTEKIIRPWPNTYTYTKALSEELVRQFAENHPVALIRPSIVVATHEDPIPGWINNIYGLTGVLVSTGLGFQRILPYKRDLIGDIVCADFVINSTLAAAWSTNQEHMNVLDDSESYQPRPQTKIYHITSCRDSPVTYGVIADRIQEIFYEFPTEKVLWLPVVNVTDYVVLEFIYTILYHIIPAIFFDFIFKIWGSEMRLMPMYRKVQKFMKANTYFMTRQWDFENTVMKTVYDKMSEEDKRFFPSDIRNYNFLDFSNVYYLGMRAYIMHEIEFDMKRAIRKVRLLQVAHAIVLVLYYSGWTMVIYWLANFYGVTPVVRNLYVQLKK